VPGLPSRAALACLLAVTALAGGIRAYHLTTPGSIVWDEYYYARDACYYSGRPAAECHRSHDATREHPPLGKRLIEAGIDTFGYTPLGWRIASWLAGTLTVALLFLLALRLFRSVAWATLAAALLAVDPLHFVHSRIAMLDVFATLFIVAALLFGLLDRDAGGTAVWRRPWLAAAGVSLGLAAASKWSGWQLLPALVVLVLLWAPAGRRRAAAAAAGTWLVVLPAVVYTASFAGRLDGGPATWPRAFARLQLHMWRFQDGLDGVNPYQSRPWEWLPMRRPVAYYFSEHGGTYREVLAVGSPPIWWAGAIGVLVAAAVWIRRRSSSGPEPVLVLAAAALYLSWFVLAANRGFVFITYMVPVVPVLCLGAAYVGAQVWPRLAGRAAVCVVAAAALAWFAFAYPVLTARPLSAGEWRDRIVFRHCGQAATVNHEGLLVPRLGRVVLPPEGWCWV